MEQISEKIMQYVDEAYMLNEKERSILKFGIESFLEIGINIIVSAILLCRLNMILEGLIFFSIFIPVRAYSGGYHADTYFRCLIFSILSLVIVMLTSNKLHIAMGFSFALISWLLFLIWVIAPVINAERPVSYREYQRFTGKLRKILIIIEVLAGIITIFKFQRIANVLLLSLALILISLIIGKIKYKNCQVVK